jgi:hypothetical protein
VSPCGGGNNYKTRDPTVDPWDTQNEFIHAVALTLNNFTVENYTSGPTNAERCDNVNWGRGCLYLTGGIIQRTRGGVGIDPTGFDVADWFAANQN